jgi:cell division protein FtsB
VARKRRRRPPRSALLLRWLAVGVLVVSAFLYYRPLRSYVETRQSLERRAAEVAALRAQNRELQRRVAFSKSEAALALEARRLGYIKPGERLFIVKGIEAWRKANRAVSSIREDG